jgi:hypothetical protein
MIFTHSAKLLKGRYNMPATESTIGLGLWVAKAAGAIAGSAISIAYVLPRGRREAAIRFLTGVTGGVLLGTTIGAHVAKRLGVTDVLDPFEIVLMGSGLASVFFWWAIGIVFKSGDGLLADRPRRPASGENDHVG